MAISGTTTRMAMIPNWMNMEVIKLAADRPTGLPAPEDSTKDDMNSLGTVYNAPFLTGSSSGGLPDSRNLVPPTEAVLCLRHLP